MTFIRVFFLLSFLLIASLLFSQDTITSKQKISKNAIFCEFLGNAGSASLNYDRVFSKRKLTKLSISIGLGYLPIESGLNLYGAYSSLNLLLGKKRHHMEFGTGLTYHVGLVAVRNFQEKYHESEGLFLVPRIGYRYQRWNGGFFFRIAFTPFFLLQDYSHLERLFPNTPHTITPSYSTMIGISFGYSF